ncbi:MAG: hypothetical protein WKG07_00115 [Hymenobacter sp.]
MAAIAELVSDDGSMMRLPRRARPGRPSTTWWCCQIEQLARLAGRMHDRVVAGGRDERSPTERRGVHRPTATCDLLTGDRAPGPGESRAA